MEFIERKLECRGKNGYVAMLRRIQGRFQCLSQFFLLLYIHADESKGSALNALKWIKKSIEKVLPFERDWREVNISRVESKRNQESLEEKLSKIT